MLKRLLVTSFTLAALAASPALAQICETLDPGPTGRVVSVSDGDTLDLETGLTVRLVGIQAPKLPLGRDGFEAWPLGDEAKGLLEAFTLGKTVALFYGTQNRDRHGRALAHVMVEDQNGPVWVQSEMLKAGLARVYSFPDNRVCVQALYDAEGQGRIERRGIWRDPYYAIRDGARPETIIPREDGYELVEGRVLNADRVGNRVYLNFGRYWKEDFTVIIENAGLRIFEREGTDPLALENKLIRVRGWVGIEDGPRMEVTHPEQIEILGAL